MTDKMNKDKDPLYRISKRIRQLEFELEMLQKDPSANQDKISEIDHRLSELKLEYADRVSGLKEKIG